MEQAIIGLAGVYANVSRMVLDCLPGWSLSYNDSDGGSHIVYYVDGFSDLSLCSF